MIKFCTIYLSPKKKKKVLYYLNACLVPILRITMGNENGLFSSVEGEQKILVACNPPCINPMWWEYTFICRIAVFPPSIKHHLDLLNVLFCVVCMYGSENVQSTIKLYRANTIERNHMRNLRGSVICLRETSSLLFTELQCVARKPMALHKCALIYLTFHFLRNPWIKTCPTGANSIYSEYKT